MTILCLRPEVAEMTCMVAGYLGVEVAEMTCMVTGYLGVEVAEMTCMVTGLYLSVEVALLLDSVHALSPRRRLLISCV